MLIMLVAWLMDGAREAMLPQADADVKGRECTCSILCVSQSKTHTKNPNPKAQIGPSIVVGRVRVGGREFA